MEGRAVVPLHRWTCFVRSNININASQIKEHMDVKGWDGKHACTVLGVEAGHVKIASRGMDHVADIECPLQGSSQPG